MNNMNSLKTVMLKFVVVFFGILSLPVFAAASFTLLEYNLAFSLGISLPLIIIAFLIREKISNSWWYPIILLVALLCFLSQLILPDTITPNLYFSTAALFITLLSLIPRSGSFKQDASLPLVMWTNYFALGFLVLTVAALFLVSSITALAIWSVFAIALAVSSLARFSQANRYHKNDALRFNLLMLFVIADLACVYLYGAGKLDVLWLILMVTASYLIALINFSWLLTSEVKASVIKEVEKEFTPQMTALTMLGRDAVTNLPTQVSALKKFTDCRKEQGNYRYAVIVFKPINFTKVNQLLGQHNSDILLLQLAYCLQQSVAHHSELFTFANEDELVKIARLQSLQFLVILDVTETEYAPEHYVQEVCQLLFKSVPQAASFKSFSLNFELAFGVDYFDQNSASITEVVAWAGDAMLQAEYKQETIKYFDHQASQITESQLVQMEQLKLDAHQQKLQYKIQPQVNLLTKQIIAYELQVFWTAPDQVERELKDFVDVAENSGELFNICKMMISQACQFVAQNHNPEEKIKPVEIKLPSGQLLDDIFVDYLISELNRYKLNMSSLLIVIPEQLLLLPMQKINSFLSLLKTAGIGMAIDDFSGNYESLRLLRKLAIKKVKVDCATLSNKNDSQVEKMILNALVNLAEVMHIPLVGKNVNTLGTEQLYLEVGGVNGQGNRIAPAKLIEFLPLSSADHKDADNDLNEPFLQ